MATNGRTIVSTFLRNGTNEKNEHISGTMLWTRNHQMDDDRLGAARTRPECLYVGEDFGEIPDNIIGSGSIGRTYCTVQQVAQRYSFVPNHWESKRSVGSLHRRPPAGWLPMRQQQLSKMWATRHRPNLFEIPQQIWVEWVGTIRTCFASMIRITL